MQGVCDVKGRFLDVSIGHPGSTSDYLAFVTSHVNSLFEKPGFLAPGLVICGDNAYVTNNYVVTPHKNVGKGSKDAFNFYHSQVRIRIECAFGMLVHRWGILRKPMPQNVSLGKITALTYCLCKLHNFCIDEKEKEHYEQTKIDAFYSSLNGSIDVQEDSAGNKIPTDIIHGGEHSDDFIRKNIPVSNIPHEMMLKIVQEKDLHRPQCNH